MFIMFETDLIKNILSVTKCQGQGHTEGQTVKIAHIK